MLTAKGKEATSGDDNRISVERVDGWWMDGWMDGWMEWVSAGSGCWACLGPVGMVG